MQRNDMPDKQLVENSLKGSKEDLEILIERYNDYIFNVVYKMLWNIDDAKDVTQEIMITVVTKLGGFKFNSSFKTWIYRIAVNHTLNFIKSSNKNKLFSFEAYGDGLDKTPDVDMPEQAYNNVENEMLYEEVKQTCMSGMLMCLDNSNRIVFIIGEILGFSDKVGSEILDISPENFRMTLSRAKKDLYHFMNSKCGLVNKNNPCRCPKKTKSFIDAGYVNPANLLFYPTYKMMIEQTVADKQEEMEEYFYAEYRRLFRNLALVSNVDLLDTLRKVLTTQKVKSLFNLSEHK